MAKILIVDDEKDNRDTAKEILGDKHTIKTAMNADEALEKLKDFKADLVLMDIMMPGTPVAKVVPKIKTKVAYFSVVRTSEAEKEELMESGNIVGFIQKPFEIDELRKEVEKALKK